MDRAMSPEAKVYPDTIILIRNGLWNRVGQWVRSEWLLIVIWHFLQKRTRLGQEYFTGTFTELM